MDLEVLAKENTTYYLTVEPQSAAYQQFDINITLTSINGDADLIVGTPGASTNLASTRNVGQDIVFVYRTELAAGKYAVVVLGYALETQYELTVQLVEQQRSLRPAATLALGQMMVDCCATDETACTALKAQFPQLNSNDPDVNPDYCYMHGNVCSREGMLLELAAFAGGDLSCTFPNDTVMGVFKGLQRLDLSANRITGNITQVAKTLATLPKLQYVDLGFDGLEGSLDSACGLAKTKKLASLNLMNNALTGSIPACFGQLPALTELHLDYNQLTGAIPAFDVPNSPMVYFSAAYQLGFLSGLSGGVPPVFDKMKSLAYLDLGGNMLTGTLPPNLPVSMVDLRLGGNFFSGTLPASYGLMQNLVSMELDANNLEGTLPAAWAAMKSLKLMDLSTNYLTGALPVDWTGSPNLTLLLLANNGFQGELPTSLALLPQLVVLDVSMNALSGTLKDFAFATVANRADLYSTLRYFDISNNTFAGDMNDLDGLKHMGVFSNSAPSAVTPDQLQVLAANTSESTIRLRAQMTPRTFQVSNNGFDGWFPEWLVEKVAGCKEDITVVLDGALFTCPPHGFELEATPPPGRLDGLFCYNAPASAAITDATPMTAISTMVHVERHSLSGGAIVGIVFAVLIGVALLAGGGYWLYRRWTSAGSFERFDKYDSGAAAGPMQGGGATNVFASSKFGNRMVYPDMQEVEMGDAPPLARESPSKGFNVNLKSGRKLELP
ncbi:g5510 [Coccomyxa elongata]